MGAYSKGELFKLRGVGNGTLQKFNGKAVKVFRLVRLLWASFSVRSEEEEHGGGVAEPSGVPQQAGRSLTYRTKELK